MGRGNGKRGKAMGEGWKRENHRKRGKSGKLRNIIFETSSPWQCGEFRAKPAVKTAVRWKRCGRS